MIPIIAHGVGSRGDLPLPLWQFAWAAVAALAISFVALGALWTQPRLAALADGRPLPGAAALKPIGRLFGAISFALFLLVLAAGLFGEDRADLNITPVAVYVVLWVGVALAAALIGDLWPTISPFEWIASGIERVRGERSAVTIPSWASWTAPLMGLLFLTLELVHPVGESPRLLGIAAAIYTAVMVIGTWLWGRVWLRANDLFAALFSLLGAMAPIGRDANGALRLRLPLVGLANLAITPAMTALLLVVLGGTSFDGFAESEVGRSLFDWSDRWALAAFMFVGLVVSIVMIAALFLIATRFSATATGTKWSQAITDFAPSLVPIAFGYTVAHYAQLLIDETQTFTFRLSDPFGYGWDLFGMAGNRINFNLVSVDAIAWLQVVGIVLGHIAAVVIAHDRAIERYETHDATRSQLAMLFVMVVYSVLGLWLLLNA